MSEIVRVQRGCWPSLLGLLVASAAMWALVYYGASAAFAHNMDCGPYDRLAQFLHEEFKEEPTDATGVTVDTLGIFKVFASEGGATFSIVVVDVRGTACLVATGTDWDPGQLTGKGV